MMRDKGHVLWRLICVAFVGIIGSVGVLVRGQQPPVAASLAARLEGRIQAGSALDTIRRVNQNRLAADLFRGNRNDTALPLERFAVRMAGDPDRQDRAPLPDWFRAYLRANYPGLPKQGRYQYPRASFEILEWMVAHQTLQRATPSRLAGAVRRSVTVGTNVNITSLDERDSESSIAVSHHDPGTLLAASNNIGGSGFQRQYSSTDAGATWLVSELPFPPASAEVGVPTTAMQCDPSVAFTSDGTAWTATLGVDSTGSSMSVQVYRSYDRGRTWTYVARLSNTPTNDKEMLAIDTAPSSRFKDSLYVAWDVPGGGIRFSRSGDAGRTWQAVNSLSNDQAIGVHVATGPGGEVYVGWPDTASRQVKIRRSTDGGATFGSVTVIATTNAPYEIAIPAMCQRNALIYLTLGVDKSSGPRKGTVYATWTDLVGTEPGCQASASSGNSSVFFSSSSDGTRWTAAAPVGTATQKADRFNQWLDVDEDGTVHMIFYDTRDDPQRGKTHLYYLASTDGGATWINETRVTTAPTDETISAADLGNQYGDYNGLAVFGGMAHPIWTDRRSVGGKEQIFSATIRTTRAANPSPTTTRP
jgi:hypothetical protein